MPCAEHKAARCTQERDGRGEREWESERERERGGVGAVVGGIWREAKRRNIQRATAAWESNALKSCVFTAALQRQGGAFLCSSLSVVCCPAVWFHLVILSGEKKEGWMLKTVHCLWPQKRGFSRGSVQLPMKHSLCNFIYDNIRRACDAHSRVLL